MTNRLKSDGTPDKRQYAGRASHERAEKKAEKTHAKRIKELTEATIAFRAGEISQETWIAVRAKILGEELKTPEAKGAGDDVSGIRIISTRDL